MFREEMISAALSAVYTQAGALLASAKDTSIRNEIMREAEEIGARILTAPKINKDNYTAMGMQFMTVGESVEAPA